MVTNDDSDAKRSSFPSLPSLDDNNSKAPTRFSVSVRYTHDCPEFIVHAQSYIKSLTTNYATGSPFSKEFSAILDSSSSHEAHYKAVTYKVSFILVQTYVDLCCITFIHHNRAL
jgi:hypothetical protein